MLGHGLNGRRLGIYGMGRIGREVAKRCKGFDLEIHYHNRSRLTPDLEDGAVYHDTIDGLMSSIDFLVICVPGGSSADRSINSARIAKLPKHGVVVNISRGLIVDDDALIGALENREIFAAGLDVFAGEPEIDPRYRTLSNIFMSPHMGSATHETRDLMGMMLLDGLAAIQNGTRPSNQLV
jgi:glyoxylate reductase